MAQQQQHPQKSMDELRTQQRDKRKSCFVLGYTGEVGKQLTRELATSQVYDRVVLLGRRHVDYPAGDPRKQCEQHIIDFEHIDKLLFNNLHVGFCALGTTQGKSGKDGFFKVDHDYVMASATAARQAGCEQFHIVSSMSANENSWFFYTKVKGQVERALANLQFPRLSIYRPGVLLCDREEGRPVELVVQKMFNFVGKVSNVGSAPTDVVARAMVNASVLPFPVDERCRAAASYGANVEILENADIHNAANRV